MDAETVVEDLGRIVQELDPACLSGSDASKLMGVFERGEKLCAAAKGLLAARASDTREWARAGARSAEEWLAGRWGVSSSDARSALRTAETASKQPDLEEALRADELSSDQASEIAGAAKSDPSATRRLLRTAKSGSGLRPRPVPSTIPIPPALIPSPTLRPSDRMTSACLMSSCGTPSASPRSWPSGAPVPQPWRGYQPSRDSSQAMQTSAWARWKARIMGRPRGRPPYRRARCLYGLVSAL